MALDPQWTQVISGVLLGGGGVFGLLKYLGGQKPGTSSTVRAFRNAERANLMQTLERFEEYFRRDAGTLARIEGKIGAVDAALGDRISGLEKRVGRLEQGRQQPT